MNEKDANLLLEIPKGNLYTFLKPVVMMMMMGDWGVCG